jgi:hypothetical protein
MEESYQQSYKQISNTHNIILFNTYHILFNTDVKLLRIYEKLLFTDEKLLYA